jgi:hypothetical protein
MELMIIENRLPIAITMETMRYEEEARCYELTFEVKAAPATRVIATINKPDDARAFVASIDSDRARLLPNSVRKRMLLLTFRLLLSEMLSADGEAIEWHMNDASRWIRYGLGFVDGQRVIRALLPHVPYLDTFESWNCVRIG